MWLSIVLVLIGLTAIFIELFVPAGGIVGIAGGGCMIGAIINAYLIGSLEGTIMLIACIVLTPVFIFYGLKLLPHTPVGKKIILNKSLNNEEGFSSADEHKYSKLVDNEGTAFTALRPAGMIKIENEKYSVVTGGEYIDKGKKVRVIKTEGNKIIVKQIK